MKIILISFLFTSCASAYVPERVEFKLERWEICHKDGFGEDKHLKGFCYKRKYVKKRFMLPDLFKLEDEFCSFEDENCLLKFHHAGKTIK